MGFGVRGLFRRAIRWFFGVRRIDRITIARSVLDDLFGMARGAHPKEMLAFFSSTRGLREGVLHIDEIQLQAYDADSDSAHVMLSQLPMTTSILGTVHSHPGGSTRPSDADRELFSKFGYLHAIIGEPYVLSRTAFYDKNGRRIAVVVVD